MTTPISSRPLASIDAWARVLDKLDDIDDRLRAVELDLVELGTKLDASRSKISGEVRAVDDVENRVRELEKSAAEDKGRRKASAAISIGGAGGVVGLIELIKHLIGAST